MESVIGIDAGGSSVRAMAVSGDTVVHRGSGGPGNPHTVPGRELAAHYSSALDGCPPAHAVAVCAAGAGSRIGRERLRRMLEPSLHGARLAVLPDYTAAWSAAPRGTEIVVIAGTGSVIASRAPTTGYTVTGGAGLAGGDPGSALSLGRAALAHAGRDAGRLSAAEAARHAPRVTRAAESGEPWAVETLHAEIAVLADEVRLHLSRIGRVRSRCSVAATGGVLRSSAAMAALTAELGPSFDVVRMRVESVVGAVQIARELAS